MPLTKISAPKHVPIAQVKALANGVQEALIETCNVPHDDLFQLISRYEEGEMILDPHFGGNPMLQRSSDACVVEIVYLAGRTDDQKRALYQSISQRASQAGWRGDDVMVALIENTRMDWSLGQGLAYADVHVNLHAKSTHP